MRILIQQAGNYLRPARALTASRCLWLLLLSAALSIVVASFEQAGAQAPTPARPVLVTDLNGAIGPANADHIRRALDAARQREAQLLVVRMDTPGGLDAAMRDIVALILASEIPVATWVTPSGARAASAGTYILTASHIAAMSPATNVGSSTPVAMGSGSQDLDDKLINDAAAYLAGLAELRGRNTDWAVLTVTEAANLSATQALEAGVIDVIAEQLPQLLASIDGKTYRTGTGALITLDVDQAEIVNYATDWRHSFLGIITNPNVAYLLLIVGIYGLILEFYSPGVGVAGITGLVCLLIAGYALQLLPISYAGAALILLGIALMIFEIFTPSFGLLGIGGLIAFVLGSVMLMDTNEPAWQISLALIAAMAVSTGGVILLVVGAAIRAQRQPDSIGNESLIGQIALATEDFESEGHVLMHGEIWRAQCATPVKKGDSLHITAVSGLTLITDRTPVKPSH